MEYAKYLKYKILNKLTIQSKLTPWPKDNPNQYWFCTKSCIYLTNISKLWYNNDRENKRIKRLPYNINEVFTEETLAYWFMDDGYSDIGPVYYLCTDNFSLKEVHKLINILSNKFNISSTLKPVEIMEKFVIE